jgi:hypothetical protein
MPDVPRIAPLLAQLDMSLALALERLQGVTDEEFLWAPSVGAATVARGDDGRLGPVPVPDGDPRTRTIALLAGHLGEMALMRADYTNGDHRLTRDDITWPDRGSAGIEFVRDGWGRWRGAIADLDDAELDVVGRCDWPRGLDPTLPILDIVWWMNRELIHHTAEMAFVRDLYATRSA